MNEKLFKPRAYFVKGTWTTEPNDTYLYYSCSVLVTSIFSMAEMWNESELTAMRRNHGDWHIALQNLPEEKVQQIMKNSDIAFSSWYDEINADTDQGYYIGGKNVDFIWYRREICYRHYELSI